MKKLNNYQIFGLVSLGAFLMANYLELLPHFFKGLFFSLGIVLLLMGGLTDRIDLSNLRKSKMNLLKRVFGK